MLSDLSESKTKMSTGISFIYLILINGAQRDSWRDSQTNDALHSRSLGVPVIHSITNLIKTDLIYNGLVSRKVGPARSLAVDMLPSPKEV